MASLNKVQIIGNLGADPEVRYTPSGAAVCTISVATTRKWKNKEGGEENEETEWHRVVFWNRLAEVVGEYVRKGHPIYIEGYLKTKKWQDKDGVDRYTTEVMAEHMQMLGTRGSGEGSGNRPPTEGARQPSPGRAAAPAPRQAPKGDEFDDDIPF